MFGYLKLKKACKKGDLEKAKKVLEKNFLFRKSKINKVSNEAPLIILASERGHLDIVRLLYENGSDLNLTRTSLHRTALFYASGNGFLEVVRFLIENGAEINPLLCSPISCALQARQKEIVEFLLEKGAKFDKMQYDKDEAKEISFINLIIKYGWLDTCELLISKVAEFRALERENDIPPLIYAIQKADIKFIKLILNNYPNISLLHENKSAMDWAVQGGNDKIIDLVKQHHDNENTKEDKSVFVDSFNPYWQCPKCNAVLKKGANSDMADFLNMIGNDSSRGHCLSCGAVYSQTEIYNGKWDIKLIGNINNPEIIRIGYGYKG